MPTFIDESGDTGSTAGSLPFFRLAAVWVPSLDTAERFREAVRGVRRTLKLKGSHEFEFARTHNLPDHRNAFLTAALESDFRFAVCCIDKTANEWRTAGSKLIHEACAAALASSLCETYRREELALPPKGNGKPQHLRELVIVDDNEDTAFLDATREAFIALESPHTPKVSLVSKVKFRGSGPEEMLQLADMVVGATGAHVSGDDLTWFRLIRERCVGLTTYPLKSNEAEAT